MALIIWEPSLLTVRRILVSSAPGCRGETDNFDEAETAEAIDKSDGHKIDYTESVFEIVD